MNKTELLESLAAYHTDLVSKSAIGLFEQWLGDERDTPWIPDIVSGRAHHEYELEKFSKNPLSRKRVSVGSANAELTDNTRKMNFYNRDKGKYKLNSVDDAKKTPKDNTDDFVDPAEHSIKFSTISGVPMLEYTKELVSEFKNIQPKKLPAILSECKITDARIDSSYLTWTREDIKNVIKDMLFSPATLGYLITDFAASERDVVSAVISYGEGEETHEYANKTVLPSGVVTLLYVNAGEPRKDGRYAYSPRNDVESMDGKYRIDVARGSRDINYIRITDVDRQRALVVKVTNNFPVRIQGK